MLKFIAGVIIGIIVSQIGFGGLAVQLDKGVKYVQEASHSLEKESVDKATAK